VGVVGAFAVLLICALVWVVKQWRKDIKEAQERGDKAIEKLNERLAEEQESHQRTRDVYNSELKNSTRLAASMDDMSRQLETMGRQVVELAYRKERP
jgi:ribose 1,5-bisphosphokinase PhnN